MLKFDFLLYFRTFSDKGLISFPEYLFLLSVLTRPKSGFRYAPRTKESFLDVGDDSLSFFLLLLQMPLVRFLLSMLLM